MKRAPDEYIIATRKIRKDGTFGAWRNRGVLSIDGARDLYDQGKVEIAIGRRDGTEELFVISRKEKAPARQYFSALHESQRKSNWEKDYKTRQRERKLLDPPVVAGVG